MLNPQDVDWIAARQAALDGALAAAAREHLAAREGASNLSYDIQRALRESFGLKSGRDLCYDRPSTPLVYALWYHGRRVNTCLGLLGRALEEASGQAVRVYDLGAGTGAWQWALALVAAAMRARGARPPTIHVVNVDSSPFMLDYLELLWRPLVRAVPECGTGLTYECDMESWVNPAGDAGTSWVCASYLFDHSDKQEPLREHLLSIVDAYRPARVFLSTARPKGDLLSRAKAAVEETDYLSETSAPPPLKGTLVMTTALRRDLEARYRIDLNGGSPTRWGETSFSGVSLRRRNPELGVYGAGLGDRPIHLFRPPVKKRVEIRLTPTQRDAARHERRPAHVYGPAGCGKTVVLTERIKNLVEAEDYSQDLRILATTFNKELLYLLKDWLGDVLDKKRVRWKLKKDKAGFNPVAHAFFGDCPDRDMKPENAHLSLMHFDVLPTRIGGIKWDEIERDDFHRTKAEEAVRLTRERVHEKDLPVDRYGHVLDPEAVLEEFHRVYYGRWERGQEAWSEESYLQCDRRGLRMVLQRGMTPRQIMWSCLKRYLRLCEEAGMAGLYSFTHRRLWFLLQLQQGTNRGRFTHVFLDEYQDCTPADYDVFYYLLNDPNHFVVGGDLAQSIHVGKSASSPKRRVKRWNDRQGNFRHLSLDGSFRLPFRVSEAIAPLSMAIKGEWGRDGEDADEIQVQMPYKGSPPGARPVVVWAETEEAMAAKLGEIYDAYAGYNLDGITVLDEDKPLRVALRRAGYDHAVTDTVLRIKGLEKTCVVWSTRSMTKGGKDELKERVYTVLTRTSRLLIVALFPRVPEEYATILAMLDADRLLFWDEEAELRYRRLGQRG